MTLLTGCSKAAADIARALGLPPHTVGFTLRVKAGKIATLEVETYVNTDVVTDMANVLKLFHLKEIDVTDDGLSGAEVTRGTV